MPRNQKVIVIPPPHFREKNLIRCLQYCVVQKTHTHTVIILDFWGYLQKGKNFPSQKKWKTLMFAQMMRFQRESQQKNEEKLLQLQKENEERLFQLLQGNKEKEQENEEKQQRFFLELQKQQETLFKSLSNNQPTDSTAVFIQNAVWNAVETFIYAPDEDKTFEAYYRRYEDIYITDCADWTDAKKATTTKARNCGTQVRRLYLTKKKKNLRTWLFRNN